MAEESPDESSVGDWLRSLEQGAGTPRWQTPRAASRPAPTAEQLGPIELSPAPEAPPGDGEAYADCFFREAVRAARALPPGKGLEQLRDALMRYLHFNITKLGYLYDALKPKDRATFSVIPYLLHTNIPGQPGHQPSDEPAHGISNFEFNATIRAAVEDVFPPNRNQRRQSAMFRPAIRSLLAMGSVGTIGHSGKSDIDYWVVVDEDSLSPAAQQQLITRVEEIERWARKRGLDCHFFLVDAHRARQNDFGGSEDDSDSSGSAQGKLLKEEFYRTSVFIAGHVPLWWAVPVGVDAEGYRRVADAIDRTHLDTSLSFVDLGFIGEIDRGEFFGAALWQINKSLRSPFKSLLKMALLVRYLDAQQPLLLCDQLKDRVMQGERAPQYTDPYVLLFDAISEYFAEQRDWEAFRLVQQCFYLKVGLKLSRETAQRTTFMRRFRVMQAYITRWGWDEQLLADLDGLDTWSAERVDAMGQAIRQFMLGLYRKLIDRARTASVKINETDVTILGRRLFACFGQEAGKVQHLFTYFLREPRPEDRLAVLEAPDAEPGRRWEVHREIRRNEVAERDPPIWATATLAEAAGWLTFNGLFHQGSVVGLVCANARTTTGEFRAMLERFQALFECPDPFAIPPVNFLAPRRVRRAALVVNLDLPRTPSDASEQAGVYYLPENWDILNYGRKRENRLRDIAVVTLNSWGEVFCRRYTGGRAVADALRGLYLGIDPKAPLDVPVEILAPHDRSLPAVRNRLRMILETTDEVFLAPLPDRESRTYVYEVGGRFQIVHRSADGPRLSGARSLRGVVRQLGNSGYDRQQVLIDRLSPTLGDLRAVVDKHRDDRDGEIYIAWRQLRGMGYVIVCDETRRIYMRHTRQPEAVLLLLVRRVLQHLRGYVQSARDLRRALRVFELRDGRALGTVTQLAEDTNRVLAELARAPSARRPIWLRGEAGRGRDGIFFQYDGETFSPAERGRRFALDLVRRVLDDRPVQQDGQDSPDAGPEALVIEGSTVTFDARHQTDGRDGGVVKHLRLVDAYERLLVRCLAPAAARAGSVLASAHGFGGAAR